MLHLDLNITTKTQPASTLPLAVSIVMVAMFLVLGLVGHDPWKADEAYAFSIVYSMLNSGDWVVPMLAGEAFVEKPPLVYLLAALTAKLASPFLPLHDGARLASGVLSAITIAATAMSARAIFGVNVDAGRIAALVLAASLGFVLHARMLLTDLGVVAGVAVALYGFVVIHSRNYHAMKAALFIGTGGGIAFLSKGLVGIAALAGMALLLPLLFSQWRSRWYVLILLAAFVAALPWLLVWPAALYARSPQLFHDWFWLNNVGRFLGFAVPTLGAAKEPGFLWNTAGWFTFPALPMVVWAWWREKLDWRNAPGVQVGLLFAMLYLLMIALSSSARANYLLPLLPALAMLAPPALNLFPRWLNLAGGLASLLLFAGAALFVWLVWALAVQQGTPPDWPLIAKHLPLDHAFSVAMPICLLALTLTYALASIVAAQWRKPAFALASWSGGILVFGVAVSLLWMPWLDAAKSYREPFMAIRSHLPMDANCLSQHRVGESERGVLHYFLDVVPTRYGAAAAQRCPWVVVQGLREDSNALKDVPQHRVLWSGARPGDTREQFWLLDLRTDVPVATQVAATNRGNKP
jgi:4-amino-4-deoxy-L-arabinose transferase-like glycosyltransferase